jgi:prepilin-type N-terminal cleavage/methylation domain-containing protein/prepilin-type processing-associated H-X9-DG protein
MSKTCVKRNGGNEKAFSLIELLAVLSIIGILAVLLLPVLSKVKAYAKATTCKNHLHQMGMALKMYVDEHQSRYPYYLGPPGPAYGDATGEGGRMTGFVYWSTKLFAYYPVNWTNSGYHCPGYKGATTGPFFAGSPDRLGSYAYNVHGSGTEWTAGTDDKVLKHFGLGPMITWQSAPAVLEAQIKIPSEMLAIGESQFLNPTSNGSPGGQDVLYCRLPPQHAFDPARHGSKYNLLLCDGHTSAMNPQLLYNRTNSAAMWNYDHQNHSELWGP